MFPSARGSEVVAELTSNRHKSWLHKGEIQRSWYFISVEVTGRLEMRICSFHSR